MIFNDLETSFANERVRFRIQSVLDVYQREQLHRDTSISFRERFCVHRQAIIVLPKDLRRHNRTVVIIYRRSVFDENVQLRRYSTVRKKKNLICIFNQIKTID